ncbi:lipid-binding SYLF domain-containing protein [Rhodovibrionaceae bacterium A322]
MIRNLMCGLSVALCLSLSVLLPAKAEDNAAAKMVREAEAVVQQFLEDERWAIAKNGLGGARALMIIPSINKGGFILGFERGVGLLMTRKGKDWSDPVFVTISNSSIGLQAGATNAEMLMLLMADEDVEKISDQTIGLGGSSGLTLGDFGAGVSASGNTSSGVAMLFATESSGLFAGGSFMNTAMSLDNDLNQQRYGIGDASVLEILKRPGDHEDSKDLRDYLSEKVEAAWKGTDWD